MKKLVTVLFSLVMAGLVVLSFTACERPGDATVGGASAGGDNYADTGVTTPPEPPVATDAGGEDNRGNVVMFSRQVRADETDIQVFTNLDMTTSLPGVPSNGVAPNSNEDVILVIELDDGQD